MQLHFGYRECGTIGIVVAVLLGFGLPCNAQDKEKYVAWIASVRADNESPAKAEIRQLVKKLSLDNRVTTFAHRVELNDGSSPAWRIALGPPSTLERIEALCANVKAKHQYCEVVSLFELAQVKPGLRGDLILRELDDGVHKETVQPIEFVDSQARKWTVPVGTKTDGASIPRPLWSIIGSPFTGKYVKAAVIHDHYVATKYRSWMDTHGVLYEVMIKSGVDTKQALVIWAAVHRFGPRWTKSESRCWGVCAGGDIVLDNVQIIPTFSAKVVDSIVKHIEADPSISRDQVLAFISTTYNEIGSGPSGARLRGFISGSVSEEEGKFTRKNGYFERGDDDRRFVEGEAPHNWPNFGEANISLVYRVTRVKAPNTLKVRVAGNPNSKIVGEIPASGRNIKLTQECFSTWCEIRYENLVGWVNTTFLAFDWEFAQRAK